MAKYKKRKDGRYEAKVNLGIDENGKYIRPSAYGRTIAELEAEIDRIKTEHTQGVDMTAKKPTVREWGEKWLSIYKADIGESQIGVYEACIYKWLKPLHELRIDRVKEVQLQELLATASKELAQSSMDKLYNCTRAIFSTAKSNRFMAIDPSENLIKPTKLRKTKRHALNRLERDILTGVCLKMLHTPEENEAIMTMIMMYAGLRIGELTALFPEDIKEDYIHVSKTIIFGENANAPIIKGSPKSEAGIRSVPVIEPLLPFIQRLQVNFPDVPENSPVFTRNGLMYSKTMRRRYWNRMMKLFKASWEAYHSETEPPLQVVIPPIRNITPHWLRHTFATLLYEADVDIKSAQKWMGDATADVVMEIYMELSEHKEIESEIKLRKHFSDDKNDDNDDTMTTQNV